MRQSLKLRRKSEFCGLRNVHEYVRCVLGPSRTHSIIIFIQIQILNNLNFFILFQESKGVGRRYAGISHPSMMLSSETVPVQEEATFYEASPIVVWFSTSQ